MKTDSHYTIGVVKCLFDAISMVYVNIEVKYTRVHSQKFQNADYNVVDVTETACLGFFSMVIPAWPVDNDVT